MPSSITIAGIDLAISQLNYRNTQTSKYKCIQAIRRYYESSDAIENLRHIDSDILIKTIWDIDDDVELIKSKRKNFNSIRSTINADFMRLYQEGKNKEGITISAANVFEMSESAKNQLLSSFADVIHSGEGPKLKKISEVLSLLNDILPNIEKEFGSESHEDLKKVFDLVNKLSQNAAISQYIHNIGAKSEKIETDRSNHLVDNFEIADNDQNRKFKEKDLPDLNTDSDSESVIVEVLEGDSQKEMEVEKNNKFFDDLETLEQEQIQEVDEDLLETLDTENAEESQLTEVEDLVDDLETLEQEQIQEVDEDLLETLDTENAEEPQLTEVEDLVDDLETLEQEQIQEVDEDLLETVDIENAEESQLTEVEDLVDELETLEQEQIQEAVGLPLDNTDVIKKPAPNLLSEQFDGYLGTMERYYNQYILVPTGKYIIGRAGAFQNELPLQHIHLPALYMGKFPVTNALFEVFIEKTGYQTTAEKRGWGMVYYGRFSTIKDPKSGRLSSRWNASIKKIKTQGAFWYQPGGPGTTLHRKRNHPVVQVSLIDAMAFAAWIGKRLPSEIEWEAVMRTAKGYLFPWGDEWQAHGCNHDKTGISDTTPVDEFSEGMNQLGIADAIGNIFEWTATQIKPPFAKIRKTACHVVRGSSWISGQETTLLSRSRFESDFTANILGFRCVAD